MKLYHYWRSSSSWRVRLALEYKKLPCEYVAINLLENEQNSPEHLKRNPLGNVPVLETDSGQFIGESISIMEFFDESHAELPLLPKNPYDRATVRQIAQLINSGIQPIQNLRVMKHLSDDADKRKEWSHFWIDRGFEALETLLSEHAGQFSFGDEFGMADCCLEPQVYNANRFEVDMKKFPTIQRVHENILSTEAYLKSEPDCFKP